MIEGKVLDLGLMEVIKIEGLGRIGRRLSTVLNVRDKVIFVDGCGGYWSRYGTSMHV